MYLDAMIFIIVNLYLRKTMSFKVLKIKKTINSGAEVSDEKEFYLSLDTYLTIL